jgi:hypothetical protein
MLLEILYWLNKFLVYSIIIDFMMLHCFIEMVNFITLKGSILKVKKTKMILKMIKNMKTNKEKLMLIYLRAQKKKNY